MSRPLQRGISGMRNSGGSQALWDSQFKDKTENGDIDKRGSLEQSPLAFKFPLLLSFPDKTNAKHVLTESGYFSDPFSIGSPRSRHKIMMFILKFNLVLIALLALAGSFMWAISISTLSRGQIFHGYRRLQQKLVSDLLDIGELSYSVKSKELEFCVDEYENYVPCYNNSDNGSEVLRQCGLEPKQNCLVLPPVKYKIPLKWPTGRDVIWVSNVKITAQEVLSSGSFTKRMMMLEKEQITFGSASLIFDGIEDYSHQIAEMIGLRNESYFIQAGVRTILDIGCGYGSFGVHLFSSQLLTMCVANYESSGSQVQLTLERGLPAMIGSISSTQLPFPLLSFDMLHCARCGIDWDEKDGILLVEADRLLKPGGYFVWTSPLTSTAKFFRNKENQKRWNFIREYAENICWEMLSQQEETAVWRKTTKRSCYTARRPGMGPSLCSKGHDVETAYYHPLESCLTGTRSNRWIPIEERTHWPSRAALNNKELAIYGLQSDEFVEDSENWRTAVINYWSLLSPLIFSDHPKRPGDEEPSPPYNMLRNVLDMNAHFGGFNSALLNTGKNVWVMNVVPITARNHLPMILDRGFVGVLHDWCEAFPTYPRTYDLVHADGLLSLEDGLHRCSMFDIFTEIDRLLRPEGWVIIRDTADLVDSVRAIPALLKWDARIAEIERNSDEKLMICQKPFFKRQIS